jgi:hypothetical protein
MPCNKMSSDISKTFTGGNLRNRHNFDISGGETNASIIDVFYSKCLRYGVILEARVKHFDHCVFVDADIQFELLHVTRVGCETISYQGCKFKSNELTLVKLTARFVKDQ